MNLSLDLKHNIWTYLVLNSVKWKYWNDACRENESLAYVVISLINEKFELVPQGRETWYLNLFCFKFGKLNTCVFSTIILFLDDSCRKNEILAFMVTNMINLKVELVSRCPLMQNMILIRVSLDFGKPEVWECGSMILKPKMIWCKFNINLINREVINILFRWHLTRKCDIWA